MPRNYSKEDKRYMTKDITPEYPADATDAITGRRVIDGPVDVSRSNKVFSGSRDDNAYDPDDVTVVDKSVLHKRL